MKKVAITGVEGLLGFHVRSALHAINCGLQFKGQPLHYEIVPVNRNIFQCEALLSEALSNCDCVVHLAGVNRASSDEVANGNQRIAKALIAALDATSTTADILYSNSTHADTDSAYGVGKRVSGELLGDWCSSKGSSFTDFILPHIFGEGGKPNYNTVTATLSHHLVEASEPVINEGAVVELLHAGVFSDHVIENLEKQNNGRVRLSGKKISVQELYERLNCYKKAYDRHEIPSFSNSFDVQLFNTYRMFEYPATFPRAMKLNEDQRGVLYEVVKGGGGGQTFLSWTEPGVERGNHFHRSKFERFLVLSGSADICIRRVFDSEVLSFSVDGARPHAVDMPTLHTHKIVNTGDSPLLTLFWTNEIFDPENPDTYFDKV